MTGGLPAEAPRPEIMGPLSGAGLFGDVREALILFFPHAPGARRIWDLK